MPDDTRRFPAEVNNNVEGAKVEGVKPGDISARSSAPKLTEETSKQLQVLASNKMSVPVLLAAALDRILAATNAGLIRDGMSFQEWYKQDPERPEKQQQQRLVKQHADLLGRLVQESADKKLASINRVKLGGRTVTCKQRMMKTKTPMTTNRCRS